MDIVQLDNLSEVKTIQFWATGLEGSVGMWKVLLDIVTGCTPGVRTVIPPPNLGNTYSSLMQQNGRRH